MSDEAITVGITAFREGRLLSECWDSILAQTDQDFDVVLVLDGGADRATRDVFDTLKRIRVSRIVLSENGGPYVARNRAFAGTATAWHYYVDGDDVLAPTAIAELRTVLRSNPDADIVYSDQLSWWPGKPKTLSRSAPTIDPESLTAGHALFGASLIRTDLWRRLGGYAYPLRWTLADLDFYMGACELRARFVYLPRPIYHYRRRLESISETYTDRYHEIYELIVSRHPRLFADFQLRDRFLALGHLATARWNHQRIHMDEAEHHARRARELGRPDEAGLLLRRIRRDRAWPPLILRMRRRVTIGLSQVVKRLAPDKALSRERCDP
jgi:glycosyltransferase involved in cell wall biosynthesis